MTFKGTSGFAIMNKNFPVGRFLSQYPDEIEKPFLPVLYKLFGKNWRGVKMFCDKFKDRPHLVQFHMCFRTPDRLMGESAREVQAQMAKICNPNTRVIVCPILEDIETDKSWKPWAKLVRANCEFPLVRCGINSSAGGKFEEKHGNKPAFDRPAKKRIANLDGVSVFFRDGEQYFNQISVAQAQTYLKAYDGSFAVALWSANQQGLGNSTGWGGAGAPPPKQREFIVTDEAIENTRILLK